MKKYQKRTDQFVVAVQLDLYCAMNEDTPHGAYPVALLRYSKWGSNQEAKPGDWLVNNDGEVYTVDQDTFAKTYIPLSQDKPGCYAKTGFVWARQVWGSGSIQTKEGKSYYWAGDYVVANNEDGSDVYPVPREKFESMYEVAVD